METDLLRKYAVPGPRYTSYPTVPYWEPGRPADESWEQRATQAFLSTNGENGISLYIHLPYCESLCTYCGCTTRITRNHLVERPYIMALLNEWSKYLDVFGVTPRLAELHLGGGTPTFFSPENLKLLLDGILATVVITPDAEFSFEGHPANTSREHLETLYALGFRRVSFGIQDFDEKVQDAIHRFQTVEEVAFVTSTAREIGYTSINYDLIYGLPFQTLSGIVKTINEVIQLQPDRIAFYSYAHVPWLKPGQRKFTEMDLPEPDTKRALYETGREMLEGAGFKEVGMDHFALANDPLMIAEAEGRLNRNFMGYTTTQSELLIGLGASAISDCGTAYVQNEKTVEDYIAKANKNEWAYFRGHLLNREDRILREHITNLMCRFETDWSCTRLQTESWYEGLERLEEMEADGLLVKAPYKLTVTEKGKGYVRNICMAFDARLWRNLPSTQLFSSTI
ncbi:MAG: oxygen-independent coproporphyrinogen oxidase [Bacteroidota bacterium]|jgi:oxygen-independent coproporphyrinogen-3 oxidase